MTQGKPKEALVYLEQAARLNATDAELHHLIADADERLGNPLDAVHEYQRAAELNASEPNLFDWGTELLLHRAPEAAAEVFTGAMCRFPGSSRMRLGAAVAWYAKGSYDQAATHFFAAVDINPNDPGPYLFLGKIQSPEITGSAEFLKRMERFAELQPQNAWANYYYALSLRKRQGAGDAETLGRVQSLFEKAVRLDPKLAAGHLQLGNFYYEQHNLPAAIREYQSAIQADPALEQAPLPSCASLPAKAATHRGERRDRIVSEGSDSCDPNRRNRNAPN